MSCCFVGHTYTSTWLFTNLLLVAGYCYSARAWRLADVSAACMQEHLRQVHRVAANLPHSEFVPACLKTHYNDR